MAMNPSPSLASASLYVGDLHFDVTERELFELFSVVGPVASIRVLRDAMTRRSLGYAYVNFHNVVDAERALDTLNYNPVKGTPIRIMWKHRDPSMRKSGIGNVFIKNLEKTVDSRALNDTFSQFGNILSCKVVTDEAGNSKGYGFVQYETKEEADLAIEKVNGNLIADKAVYVGPFIPRTERSRTGMEPKYTNVFVKNLEESVTDEQMREQFEKYGTITSAVVMKDESGKSKCFGFVNFEQPEQARAAVDALHGQKVFAGEKPVFCGKAEKKAKRETELRRQWEQRKAEQMAKYQGVNLYVKNLDDTIDDDKLRQNFSPFGTITSAKVMVDDKGNSKGFGFVCYSTPDEATRAVTDMNGKMILSKPIYVALHQPKEVRRAQLQAQNAQRAYPNVPRFPTSFPPQMPILYAPGPGAPPNQRPGPGQMFIFPHTPMPTGRWMGQRGAMPQMPMQRGQTGMRRRGQPGQGQAGQVPVPQGQPQANAAAVQGGNRVKFGANVRNREGGPTQQQAAPMPQQPQAPIPAPMSQPQVVQVPPASMTKEQLASALVTVAPEQAKQMLGERLYALIAPTQGNLSGKITGMLLEGLDNSELLMLIDSPDALQDKILEAINALQAHSQPATEG